MVRTLLPLALQFPSLALREASPPNIARTFLYHCEDFPSCHCEEEAKRFSLLVIARKERSDFSLLSLRGRSEAILSPCHCEEGAKRLTKQSLSPITAILRLPRRPAFSGTPRNDKKEVIAVLSLPVIARKERSDFSLLSLRGRSEATDEAISTLI